MRANRLPALSQPDITARQARVSLCVLFALGLALRLYATLSEPMGINGFSDDNAYLNAAAVFAKTGYVTYAQPAVQSAVLGPGMPLLLGLLFRLFGYQQAGLWVSHIVFSCIGLVTAYGVYLLGAALHSRRAGVLAAGLTALELGLVSANSMFYTETPYMCLNVFAFYLFLRCAREWRLQSFLGGVACLCGAAAFKGLALLAPLCVLPLLWRRSVPLKRWLPKVALAGVIFALVFLPWCVRNQLVAGTFAPFPVSQGDQKLLGTYEGIGYPAGSYQQDVDTLDAAAWEQGYQADVYRRLAVRGDFAQARLRRWVTENPVGFAVTHLLYKPATLLGMSFYPHRVANIAERPVQYAWWALLALACWGLLGMKLRRIKPQAGFYLPALYLALVAFFTALYVPLARYNAPHAPFVLLYAAVGLCELWASLQSKRAGAKAPAEGVEPPPAKQAQTL